MKIDSTPINIILIIMLAVTTVFVFTSTLIWLTEGSVPLILGITAIVLTLVMVVFSLQSINEFSTRTKLGIIILLLMAIIDYGNYLFTSLITV
jgi:hypothetical protein